MAGGERQIYFAAGTQVPAVEASANTDGYYLLTAGEMNALLNP